MISANEQETVHMSLTGWAQRLRATFDTNNSWVLSLGRELLEARADVGHGAFLTLFRGHRYAIVTPLPFSLRKAEYYMEVARTLQPFSQHVAILPRSLRTALQLCKLEPTALYAAILRGQVRPDMTEKEARALRQGNSPPMTSAAWSVEAAEQRFRRAINIEIDGATPDRVHEVGELLKRLTDELERATSPERLEAVADARDDLDIHDAEPGGYRIFEDEQAASTHPGAPAVIGGVKSTYPDWYRVITTKAPGVTPLTRFQVEKRLDDLAACRVPTNRTLRTYVAVQWALMGMS